MTLAASTHLGPYEIVAPLGAGGMGEVYRARDPRLGREVAIKVLPETLADDPSRLGRVGSDPDQDREGRVEVEDLEDPHLAAEHQLERVGRDSVADRVRGIELDDARGAEYVGGTPLLQRQ